MNPTYRSLQKLRSDGWCAGVVERWIPSTGAGYRGPIIRKDLFSAIDIVAVKPGEVGALGIQSTTDNGGGVSARSKKALASSEMRAWVEAGNGFEVHGWKKRGNRWTVRIVRPFEAGKPPRIEYGATSLATPSETP